MSSLEDEPQEYALSDFDRRVRKAVANYLKTPSALPPEFLGYLGPYLETQNIQLPISSVIGNFLVETNTAELGGNIHGRAGMVRAGTTPFDFFQLTYDSVYDKWVSNPIVVCQQQEGGYNTVSTSYEDIPDATQVLLPWRTFDTAGIKPQVRLVAQLANAGGTSEATVQFTAVDTSATPGAGVDSSWSISRNGSGQVKDSGWQELPSLTLSDFLLAEMRLRASAGTAAMDLGTLLWRWVSK